MLSKQELQTAFNKVLSEMPRKYLESVTVEFDRHQPLHGTIDVIISRGKICLAMGKFQEVKRHNNTTEREADFVGRFKMAMGYFTEPWYLFGFDGENLVINDLSVHTYADEYPETIWLGIKRLIMLPEEWREEQETIADMQRYLNTLRTMIDEDSSTNNVK